MEYSVYLKYDGDLDLNLSDHIGGLCDHLHASIMHVEEPPPDNDEDDAEDEREDEYFEGTKIGFISWVTYNQALAMTYGVDMSQQPFLTLRTNSNALLELDYTRITQETIDEIGSVSNPNIMVLTHFGIAAAWRKKGMGEQILKGLIKQMKGKYGYIVILNNEPEQCREDPDPVLYYEKLGVELAGLETDPEKAQWKLNAFWQRCGFRQFKNYDNVFVCNIDQVMSKQKFVVHSVSRLT
jgi:hypothetical protein